MFFKKFVLLNPEIHKPNISNPYFGTIFISILLFAPTNNISEFLSLNNNSLAIEIAGYICPPVPPPDNIILFLFI